MKRLCSDLFRDRALEFMSVYDQYRRGLAQTGVHEKFGWNLGRDR